MTDHPPTLLEIRAAAERIRPYAHRTPVLTCQSINQLAGSTVFLKCENFQKAGAFKFRGACNAIFSLSEAEARRGVVTHSSGNHAQAIALAARLRGVAAYIVMPENAPEVKKAAVAAYGGKITYCEPTLQARETTMARLLAETGATVVHSYNDYLVIAGQGTAALELLEEIPNLDLLMTPLGGGGLLSGTALAARAISPFTRVVGVEPEAADDAYRSLQAGRILPSIQPRTIADGLLTSLGDKTFSIIQSHVNQIVTVSEAAILSAMRYTWERAKIVIEPSAAVPLAALFEKKVDFGGLRVGVILSGGNVDIGKLASLF